MHAQNQCVDFRINVAAAAGMILEAEDTNHYVGPPEGNIDSRYPGDVIKEWLNDGIGEATSVPADESASTELQGDAD